MGNFTLIHFFCINKAIREQKELMLNDTSAVILSNNPFKA